MRNNSEWIFSVKELEKGMLLLFVYKIYNWNGKMLRGYRNKKEKGEIIISFLRCN